MTTPVERIQELLDRSTRRLPPRLSRLVRRLFTRDVVLPGGSLAFYGLVSVFPLLVITFVLVGNIAGQDTLTRLTREAAQSGSMAVGTLLGELTSSSSSLSWVTVVAALWPATAYGGGLRRALAQVSPGREEMPGLRGRLLGLALVLVLPVLVLAGVPLVFFLVRLTGEGLLGTVVGWCLAFLAAVLIGALLTTGIYQLFAPEDAAVRDTAMAGLLVAFITALWTVGFVIYLRFGQVEARFGGAIVGAVVLMGVWLFVANILLLAGYHGVLELDEDA